jgi:hypothetical protein
MKERAVGRDFTENNFPEITSFRDCTEQHILGLQNVMSADVLKGVFCSKRNQSSYLGM